MAAIVATGPIVRIILPPTEPAPVAVTMVVSLSAQQSADLRELYAADIAAFAGAFPRVPVPTFDEWLKGVLDAVVDASRAQLNVE